MTVDLAGIIPIAATPFDGKGRIDEVADLVAVPGARFVRAAAGPPP